MHVHGGRDVGSVEGRRERRVVVARFGEELVRLHLPVERCAERAAETAQRAEERRHHLLAIVAVRHAPVDAEVRRIEPDALAVAERDRRIREIGVGENAEDIARRARHHRGTRDDPLLRFRARVGGAPDDVVQIQAVGLQPRFRRDEPIDGCPIDLQDLGLDEGRLGPERGADLRHLLLHALIGADARVLVGHHARVDIDAREVLREAAREFQRVGELLRRAAERAFVRGDLWKLGDERVLRGAPRLVGRVDLRQVPLVLVGNLAAFPLLRNRGERGGGDNERGAEDAKRTGGSHGVLTPSKWRLAPMAPVEAGGWQADAQVSHGFCSCRARYMALCCIVEDHGDTREGYAEYLTGCGYDVRTVGDSTGFWRSRRSGGAGHRADGPAPAGS